MSLDNETSKLHSEILNNLNGTGSTDYETYLNTQTLFQAQTQLKDLCNEDELQFQIVHQSEELLLKLLNYTLVEVDKRILEENTNRVISYLNRAHKIQHNLLGIMTLLHTMSPRTYQDIRLKLGNGSGQESPGFQNFLKMAPELWKSYKKVYLQDDLTNIKKIYSSNYCLDDAYLIAEALVELDDLHNKFLYYHIKLVGRSIGINTHAISGRKVGALKGRIAQTLYPELLEIRSEMTNEWGGTYGIKRESISTGH